MCSAMFVAPFDKATDQRVGSWLFYGIPQVHLPAYASRACVLAYVGGWVDVGMSKHTIVHALASLRVCTAALT
jgi:hypothetical protein